MIGTAIKLWLKKITTVRDADADSVERYTPGEEITNAILHGVG